MTQAVGISSSPLPLNRTGWFGLSSLFCAWNNYCSDSDPEQSLTITIRHTLKQQCADGTFIVPDGKIMGSGLKYKMERNIHGGKCSHPVVFCIGEKQLAIDSTEVLLASWVFTDSIKKTLNWEEVP